jgi:hypothetical protein
MHMRNQSLSGVSHLQNAQARASWRCRVSVALLVLLTGCVSTEATDGSLYLKDSHAVALNGSWRVRQSASELPVSASKLVVAGKAQVLDQYFCRIFLADKGLQVGKVVGSQCLIGYGNVGLPPFDPPYEMLLGNHSPYLWQRADASADEYALATNALIGGHEYDGTPLYLCRALTGSPSGEEFQGGKCRPGLHDCNYEYNGQERKAAYYAVLKTLCLYPNASAKACGRFP